MTAVLILSAGLGTRLAPLSSWCAKPLAPIGDRPAVGHIVAQVRAAGGPIVLNAHHLAEQVEAYARAHGLAVSREEELLGTGGGLRGAERLLGPGDVLVWNGDMIGNLDVPALLAGHARESARGAVATLVVTPRADAGGNTGLDAAGRVVRLRRETCAEGEVRTADFLGVYVVGEGLRREMPAKGDVIAGALLPAMQRAAVVAAYAIPAAFVDVGTLPAYLAANLAWLERRGMRAWVGEGGAVGEGVEVEGTVVGAGARIEGTGRVERCVVWPGATARAPLSGAIVAREGVLRVDGG